MKSTRLKRHWLSDLFPEKHRSESDVEVRVRMLNVNYGHNKEMLNACRPLYEYSWYIDAVRKYRKEMQIETALSCAIDAMPEDYVIKPFLLIHRAEVFDMLLTEYNEEETMNLFKEEFIQEGIQQGIQQYLVELVCKKLRKGKNAAEIASDLDEDIDQITQICEEAKPFSPDYNVEDVMNALEDKKNK